MSNTPYCDECKSETCIDCPRMDEKITDGMKGRIDDEAAREKLLRLKEGLSKFLESCGTLFPGIDEICCSDDVSEDPDNPYKHFSDEDFQEKRDEEDYNQLLIREIERLEPGDMGKFELTDGAWIGILCEEGGGWSVVTRSRSACAPTIRCSEDTLTIDQDNGNHVRRIEVDTKVIRGHCVEYGCTLAGPIMIRIPDEDGSGDYDEYDWEEYV